MFLDEDIKIAGDRPSLDVKKNLSEQTSEKSFIDRIKTVNGEIYKTSSDTGAFSFYYLAFRRGGDIERRVGQTFAMLCSHDGDPVYQELGEAVYCWFLSVVKKYALQLNIN